jgi:hypothetical protein
MRQWSLLGVGTVRRFKMCFAGLLRGAPCPSRLHLGLCPWHWAWLRLGAVDGRTLDANEEDESSYLCGISHGATDFPTCLLIRAHHHLPM